MIAYNLKYFIILLYIYNIKFMTKKILDEIIGWYWTISIVLAYALLSFEIISSNNIIYQGLNGTGAIGIVYISFKKKAYQPGVLNIIWAIIALISIVKIFINK